MQQFKSGLGHAWASIAAFMPKLIAFLLILIIGYFIAKAISKILDRILERVGFDRAVERGGIGAALARSNYDASDIVAKVVYYAIWLIALQLAFGVFGPNPISNLLSQLVAWLPLLVVAIIILVISSAIAKAVKDLITAALGGLSYGKLIANIAGILVVGVGGGLVRPMQQRWEQWLTAAEAEVPRVRQQVQSGPSATQQVTQQYAQQAQQATGGGTGAPGPTPVNA